MFGPLADRLPKRSSSVRGLPPAILAMFSRECSTSPSRNSQCSWSDKRRPTVVLPAPAAPMRTMTMVRRSPSAMGALFLALIAPDGVGYRHDTRDLQDSHDCDRPVGPCSFAGIFPDASRRYTATEPASSFTGHHFADSTVVRSDQRTSRQCRDARHDDPGNGCYARPRSGLHRCGTRTSRNAWWSGCEHSPRSQRSCRSVHEAADSRAALVRPGC